jgi:hypothetical protein
MLVRSKMTLHAAKAGGVFNLQSSIFNHFDAFARG